MTIKKVLMRTFEVDAVNEILFIIYSDIKSNYRKSVSKTRKKLND